MTGLLNPAGVSVGHGTPYVSPAILRAAPTGIVWNTVGAAARPDDQQQENEQANLCYRATSMINGFCNQPLRATIDIETLYGPGDFRFNIQPNGNARLLMSRSPVTDVLGGRISAAMAFPASFSPVSGANFKIERPLVGVYGTTAPGGSGDGGQAVLMAPGWATWVGASYGWQVEVTYVNGWPHGSLLSGATSGQSVIRVDDCTGWGPPMGYSTGAAGTIHDPGNQEEIAVLAASAQSGPGTLTLSAPLAYDHPGGCIVTTLPPSIMQAAILFAVSQALVRGATATTIQSVPGSASGGRSSMDYAREAEMLVQPYKRVI